MKNPDTPHPGFRISSWKSCFPPKSSCAEMSQSEPLVSVVVPAYNAARTIETTLHSVLQQTMDDIELIVVDDGSTDATPEVVRSMDDGRLRLVQQPNTGHAGARNAGIEVARGRYIAVVDADNVWLRTSSSDTTRGA